MTTQDWIDHALTAEQGVWNIGQIDKVTARALDKLVAAGDLCKSRGSFCGISPLKTIWHKPSAVFPVIEGVTLSKAVGTALEELNNYEVFGTHVVAQIAA